MTTSSTALYHMLTGHILNFRPEKGILTKKFINNKFAITF